VSVTYEIWEHAGDRTAPVIVGIPDSETAARELARLTAEAAQLTPSGLPAVGHLGKPRSFELYLDSSDEADDEAKYLPPEEPEETDALHADQADPEPEDLARFTDDGGPG
jgi:hypothetical protein